MRVSALIICCLNITYEILSQELMLDSVFNNLKYRSIGPFRGGRANAGTGVIGNSLTISTKVKIPAANTEDLINGKVILVAVLICE